MPKDPARARIRITVGSHTLSARLEPKLAPKTCAAFRTLLPLRGTLLQARWSGEAAWIPMGDLDLGVGPENSLQRPRPGQLLFHPKDASETEILVPYGVTAFAAKTGPLSGNHFLTIENAESALTEIGRMVLWEGVQEIVFEEP